MVFETGGDVSQSLSAPVRWLSRANSKREKQGVECALWRWWHERAKAQRNWFNWIRVPPPSPTPRWASMDKPMMLFAFFRGVKLLWQQTSGERTRTGKLGGGEVLMKICCIHLFSFAFRGKIVAFSFNLGGFSQSNS